MANLKTPGVYIREISLLPASVAPVATAIPGFVGYTRKRELDGATIPANTPVRITSLLDFVEHFGAPFEEAFTVDIADAASPGGDEVITLDFSGAASPYLLYYHAAMFFANGGGPCYIISVGDYAAYTSGGAVEVNPVAAGNISEGDLLAGVNACEEVDEITILIAPETILLGSGSRLTINDTMLSQCNKLQDRFAVMDVFTDLTNTSMIDGANFRNNEVGANYLKYGAAYYPELKTTLQYVTADERVYVTDSRTTPIFIGANPNLATLIDSTNGAGAQATGTITIFDNDIDGDTFTINGVAFEEGSGFVKGGDTTAAALDLATEINNYVPALGVTATPAANIISLEAAAGSGAGGNSITIGHSVGSSEAMLLSGPFLAGGADAIQATGTITLLSNNILGDDFEVNGINIVEGADFNRNAVDPVASATELMNAIVGAATDVVVTQAGTVLTLTADASVPAVVGAGGNGISLAYTPGGAAAATVSGAGFLENGADAVAASATITIDVANKVVNDTVTVDGTALVEGTGFTKGADNNASATALAAAINALPNVGAAEVTNVVTITATTPGAAGNSITLAYLDGNASNSVGLSGTNLTGGADGVDHVLYNTIKAELEKFTVNLYPSGAVAGVYASVDRDRGVWKAPANVSLQRVTEPARMVTAAQQEGLNVDPTSGKSINVIRRFTGKGNLVWGARTLAGNDNEWRYVNVRRTFTFIEESVKKASEPLVFEPNDAKTWQRMKGMVENFLTDLWRDGALAGAKPEDAFFVRVGLGETMTAVDILEGRLNVEIGLAVVRPAEFIVLKFSHKMQES